MSCFSDSEMARKSEPSVDDLRDSSDDEKVTVATVISEKKESQPPQPTSYAEEFEVEVPGGYQDLYIESAVSKFAI